MTTGEIVAIVVIVVLALVAAFIFLRRRTSENLRERFGPEYGRVVQEVGDERAAQSRLAERERRVRKYNLRPLSASDRERFAAEWRRVQARFVENPADATGHADNLLGQVMTARGYPQGEFDQRLEDLSVDHGQAVQNYRAAHDIVERHGRGEASTEDMRQAMIHYRTLFEELAGFGEVQPVKAAS
jgi:uncharacterized membrane protein